MVTEHVALARHDARHSRDLHRRDRVVAQRANKESVRRLLRISWEAVRKAVRRWWPSSSTTPGWTTCSVSVSTRSPDDMRVIGPGGRSPDDDAGSSIEGGELWPGSWWVV